MANRKTSNQQRKRPECHTPDLTITHRNQLNAVARVLEELQQCKCFYCDKDLKQGNFVVDHFIPWSMYPSDTGHNFVLADSGCNSKKSNFLASERFLDRWRLRNEEHNLSIIIGYRNWDF